MDLNEMGCEKVDWIHLAQDMDQWETCDHNNEPSGSIKCLKLLERLNNYQLLKKGSAPQSYMLSYQSNITSNFQEHKSNFTIKNCLIFTDEHRCEVLHLTYTVVYDSLQYDICSVISFAAIYE
jgi:hypothetical protein